MLEGDFYLYESNYTIIIINNEYYIFRKPLQEEPDETSYNCVAGPFDTVTQAETALFELSGA